MKNILSYSCYAKFTGKEIKEWIRFHTENQTEYTNEARKMVDYLNIPDDGEYYIAKGDYHASERKFCIYRCDHVITIANRRKYQFV